VPRTCRESITQKPPSLEKAQPQPSIDYLTKIPCPFCTTGFPGRQPSRHSLRYCQMLLWESENLRFNFVSSRPCQVSLAETGPRCPTVYLTVTRFGSHGSPPRDGTARHGVHSSRAPMPARSSPKHAAPARGSTPDLLRHRRVTPAPPPRPLPSRPRGPPLRVPAPDSRRQPRAGHGGARVPAAPPFAGTQWGRGGDAAGMQQGCSGDAVRMQRGCSVGAVGMQ